MPVRISRATTFGSRHAGGGRRVSTENVSKAAWPARSRRCGRRGDDGRVVLVVGHEQRRPRRSCRRAGRWRPGSARRRSASRRARTAVVDGDAGRRDHQAATFLLEVLAGDRLDPDAGALDGPLDFARAEPDAVAQRLGHDEAPYRVDGWSPYHPSTRKITRSLHPQSQADPKADVRRAAAGGAPVAGSAAEVDQGSGWHQSRRAGRAARPTPRSSRPSPAWVPIRGVGTAHPLPDVARHVEQSIRAHARRVGGDGARAATLRAGPEVRAPRAFVTVRHKGRRRRPCRPRASGLRSRPHAAFSHSASVGRRAPAQRQNAPASCQST